MASGAPRGVHRVISGAGMSTSGYSGCVMQRRPPPPTPTAGMQAASRLMLTAAVMQPSLQKGVFPLAHQLTHFTGKLLPNSQSSQSAGLGLDGCHDRVGPNFFCQQDYRPQVCVCGLFQSSFSCIYLNSKSQFHVSQRSTCSVSEINT